MVVLRLFLGGVLVLGVLSSCAPARDPSIDKEPLEKAHRSIDRGDYDSAISYLEDLSRRDGRPEVRQTLAAAYAGRAGLHVEKYWGFLVGFQAPLLRPEDLQSTSSFSQLRKLFTGVETKSLPEKAPPVAHLGQSMATFELWRQRMDTLPSLDPQQLADLERAVAVLEGSPKAGARLYRALLGLTLLKTEVATGFTGWAQVQQHLMQLDWSHPQSEENRRKLCAMDLSSFRIWLGQTLRKLAVVANDVSAAFPSKKVEIDRAVQDSEKIIQQFSLKEGGCG